MWVSDNVCVKHKTFVCDLCKTSHQAISHRVKSVSTSNWTMEEVQELTPENGGGNEAARRTILANAPEVGGKYSGGSRPKEGDKIETIRNLCLTLTNSVNLRAVGGLGRLIPLLLLLLSLLTLFQWLQL